MDNYSGNQNDFTFENPHTHITSIHDPKTLERILSESRNADINISVAISALRIANALERIANALDYRYDDSK